MAKKWQKKELALHQQFTEYGRNAKEWMRKCVLLLPEIARLRIWEKAGLGSIYEYAAKLAGMSHRVVDDALRILKKIEDKPALQKVVADKGLYAVRPVVSIATPETAAFWAEKAREMSKHTLQAYVAAFVKQEEKDAAHSQLDMSGTASSDQIRPGTETNTQQQSSLVNSTDDHPVAPKHNLFMSIDAEIVIQLQKLSAKNGWNALMKEFLELRAKMLDAEKPAIVEATSRHIPAEIERYVLKRSGGICEFGECLKPYEILHHTQRFALEPVHDPARIAALCKAHERIAHYGLIADEAGPARQWRLLREPEELAPKYDIDRVVAKFRTGFG